MFSRHTIVTRVIPFKRRRRHLQNLLRHLNGQTRPIYKCIRVSKNHLRSNLFRNFQSKTIRRSFRSFSNLTRHQSNKRVQSLMQSQHQPRRPTTHSFMRPFTLTLPLRHRESTSRYSKRRFHNNQHSKARQNKNPAIQATRVTTIRHRVTTQSRTNFSRFNLFRLFRHPTRNTTKRLMFFNRAHFKRSPLPQLRHTISSLLNGLIPRILHSNMNDRLQPPSSVRAGVRRLYAK